MTRVTLDLSEAPDGTAWMHLYGKWLRFLAKKDPAVDNERGKLATWIADQIEAQLPKPKPAEPTGLGAVVRDAEGVRWVRKGHTSHGEDWARQIGDAWTGGKWGRIDAVEVLSEGVAL